MASSSKFDLSSSSPDRSLYGSGSRGSHIATPMERSGSFRESMENSTSTSRSSSSIAPAEVMNFLQRLPPKLMAADHRSNKQGDLKRGVSVALGFSADDAPASISKGKPSLEELKRIRNGLRETSNKAREQVKIFVEALSILNKFFPSLPTKKRSRPDVLVNDRSGAMISSDRSMAGSGLAKIGSQNNTGTGGFELGLQKSEERTKGSVPNKRTRTSLVDPKTDARANTSVRTSGPADRERELPKLANSGAPQCEERTLSISVDGWEKSKMKKKRSGIKSDFPPGVLSAKPADGYRDSKQGMQQRSVNDARPKLNNESNEFRPGVGNGTPGVGKAEAVSQNSFCARTSLPKADLDSSSRDKKDRPNSDKERINLKAVNKTNARDDLTSASPPSSTRMNASVRGPRSSSGVAPKLSPVVNSPTVSNDWEISNCTTKPSVAVGAQSRKRTASGRSSSPPVACWPRPQKISRSARRRNFVPSVPSNDETSPMDTGSDVVGNEVGLGFPRRMPSSSPQPVRLKADPLSFTPLSEGEDVGAPEFKLRDKTKKSDEVDEKSGHSVQKISTLVSSSRKNKLIPREDLGDGIRRQGRSGRGFPSSRSLLPVSSEKLGNEDTAQQLKSTKLGLDRIESKAGRPTSRKLSDRKAYTRQRHQSVNVAADFLVGSDDGHEELLAAANAVVNPSHVFPNEFLMQMEAVFGFIFDEDIAYLKQQGNFGSATQTPNLVATETDNWCSYPNGFELVEGESKTGLDAGQMEVAVPDQNMIPLCQRLIAALIPEEEADCGSFENDDLINDAHGSRLKLDREMESNSFSCQPLHSHRYSSALALNGHMVSRIPEHEERDNDIVDMIRTGINSGFEHPINGLVRDQRMMPMMPRTGCSEAQYDRMSLDERLLLEVHSIALFPEAMPHGDQMESKGVNDEIMQLVEKYRMQVSKNKGFLERLIKVAAEAKETQEKEFEQHAMDKFVVMAYKKYMANATGRKSSTNRQAALAFVKRTLDQCKQYENIGKSCFSEPLFRDIFLTGTSRRAVLEASKSSQQSPSMSLMGQKMDNCDMNAMDVPLPGNLVAEQSTGKEDTCYRVKKRELSLHEVVGGTIGNSSTSPSVLGSSLTSSTKGKRSERDREGKVLSRTGNNKSNRSAVFNAKGERKSKAKPKQKMTQLSVSINGLLGTSEQSKSALPSGSKLVTASSNSKEKHDFSFDGLEDPIDLSGLQLPGIDELGASDDMDGHGQDLASWLNIDDDNLQDNDFMGLEIPMDDLSDVNMMV
ncbi:hypothetical protein BT93_C2303 [Corymbia citriodora subsp. variegata]|nr:hypothetical protein BT93_C2303 [Corymbia citriodora subsp. variegata]KAF8036535.1 hypothetical protein BT93_C2303 [Corymbia citriodora subsp. variegata]